MILMYHKVDIVTPTIWWVTPATLAQQLDSLSDRVFVYLDDYSDPRRQAVVTFDDAYENVARHALPLLSARKIPFEVFVIGDLIGAWNGFDPSEPPTRLMGEDHLKDVVAAGGRLQWHSRSHPHLPDLPDDALDVELSVPQRLRHMFSPPHFRWFSYPGGAHDDRAVNAARRAFAGAVSVIDGQQPHDRWMLNRVTMDSHTHLTTAAIHDFLVERVAGSTANEVPWTDRRSVRVREGATV